MSRFLLKYICVIFGSEILCFFDRLISEYDVALVEKGCFMNKSSALKNRLNVSFGVISSFSVVSVLITVIYTIIYSIAFVIIEEFSLYAISDTVDFYISFVLPQFLLPIMTAVVAFLIPLLGSFKIRDCTKSEKVPIVYFLLCIGIFPGLSVVATYISYIISAILNIFGIPIFDVSSSIPMPQTPFQIFLLFFVMAVLPAICEELIYRGFLLRGVSEFGKVGAVVVSSFAFGMMHATLQQIPFAFLIGLFLGYITLRFKSIVLPIILHFINNFISCLVLVLQYYLDEALVNVIAVCLNLFFIILSLLCAIIFVILTKYGKEVLDLTEHTDVCESITDNELSIEDEKVNFLHAVTHSWGFWLFTAIYLITTVSNIIIMASASGI